MSKLNHRRRMQTRNRRITNHAPWRSNPIEHNASVARRKQQRAFNAGWQQTWPPRNGERRGHDIVTISVTIFDEARDFDREFEILDRLALNGLDVREEHDALAAEQAEYERTHP